MNMRSLTQYLVGQCLFKIFKLQPLLLYDLNTNYIYAKNNKFCLERIMVPVTISHLKSELILFLRQNPLILLYTQLNCISRCKSHISMKNVSK